MMKKTIPAISILRVLAMVSIIFGHWCSYKNIYLYDMGGIGVVVFFMISGYLCRNKRDCEPGKWLISRGKRILIPCAVWSTVLIILGGVLEHRFETGLLPSFFGISGLSRVFPIKINTYSAMGHTWYITVNMLCYILFAVLVKSGRLDIIDQYPIKFLGIAFVLQVILAYFGFQISYFIEFFIGYIIANKEQQLRKKSLFVSAIALLFTAALRLFTHSSLDGMWIYDRVIVSYFSVCFGIFTLCTALCLCRHFENASGKIAGSAVCRYLDRMSYPLYIVHYCFLKGFLCVSNLNLNGFVETVVFVASTFVSAIILEKLSGFIKSISARSKYVNGLS